VYTILNSETHTRSVAALVKVNTQYCSSNKTPTFCKRSGGGGCGGGDGGGVSRGKRDAFHVAFFDVAGYISKYGKNLFF